MRLAKDLSTCSKPEIEDGDVTLADPAFRADVLRGFETPALRHPRALVLRPARLGTVRGDHRAARILSDAHRDRRSCARACTEVAAIAGEGRAVVEFGSGSSTKTPILLRSVNPAAYVPIDILGRFPARILGRALPPPFPALPVLPVEADFLRPIALPASVADLPKLGFFPGSTIGNMIPHSLGRPASRDEGVARHGIDAADRHGPDQGRAGPGLGLMTTPRA